MSKKKLVVGAKVCVYRIPKNCEYWTAGMNALLNKSTEISAMYNSDAILDYCGYIVPISCLKAL